MNFEEFKNEIKPQRIAIRWQRFIKENESTDMWTEDDFLLFLDNEDAIMNYSIDFDGDKFILFKDSNTKQKRLYKQKLNRLREIYQERFKKLEPETDYSETLQTATQKLLLLHELGIIELLQNIPELKNNKTKIAQLISAFTGLKTDTIRKPYAAMYSDRDYSAYNINSDTNNKTLNALYLKLGIKRKTK